MKKKLLIFLPIYILIMMTFIKVEALPNTSIYESPEVTEKGQYITLRHTITDNIQMITLSYDVGSNLKLVGFLPVAGVSCSYTGTNEITCSSNSGIPTNSEFIYPIFKITNTFTTSQTIRTSFITGQTTTNISTDIVGIERKVDVTKIELNATEKELVGGDSFQLEATVLPSNASNKEVTYTSSDNEIVTVNETGLITAVKEGKATITVTSDNVKETIAITVNPVEVELEEIKTDSNMTLKIGESKTLTLEFAPENTTADTKKITYESSDEKIATIDYKGRIVAISKGTATITVKIGDIATAIEVTVEGDTVTSTKKSGNTVGYIIAVIVSSIITLIVVFIIKTIKNKKQLEIEDNNDDEQLNKYI